MRSIHTWMAVVAAALFVFAGTAAAQTATHSVYLDTDNNAATGCTVVTADGPADGAEIRLTGTVNGTTVTAVVRETCAGGVFGSPQAQAAGYPIGINNGTNGADVIEMSTPLLGLGSGPIRIIFVSSTANGADLVVANGVSLQGGNTGTGFATPAIIPSTGVIALIVLVLLVGGAVWLLRKHPGFRSSLALLLLLGAGLAWAANFITDGQIGDWAGVNPVATDATPSTSGESTNDIVAVFAATEAGSLFVRIDIRDAQNNLPTAIAPAPQTVAEEGSITITLTGSDPEGASLTFAIATQPTLGTLGPIVPTGPTSATVQYTGNLNQAGADSFTFTVNDGSGTSLPATVNITITPVNDPPVVTAATFAVVENSPNGTVVGTVTGTDPDIGQTLTWSITAGNTGGAFAINPATGEITVATTGAVVGGPFSLTVQATDNGGAPLSGSNTITVNVTSINDEPSFTAGANQALNEDAPAQNVPWATAISAGPPDEAGQTLTFTVSNDNNALFAVQPAIDATGNLTYTLAANANGIANVAVFLMDNGGTAGGGDDTSPTVNFTITVTPVNDAPSFSLPASPNQAVPQNSPAQTVPNFATLILAGPPDESGQTLTFTVTVTTNPGLFSVAPDIDEVTGNLTYTPMAGQLGTADISVILADNGGTANGGVDTSTTQTFTITLTDINDAPVPSAMPASPYTLPENTAPGTLVTTIAPNDPDVGQTHTYAFQSGNTGNVFAIDAAGAITVVGPLNFEGSDDPYTLVVRVTDNGLPVLFGDITLTVNLSDVNDAPLINSIAPTTATEDAPYTYNATRTDEDGPGQTWTLDGANTCPGAAIVGATGVYTFTPTGPVPPANCVVAIQVCDGGVPNLCATQSTTVTITPINSAPVIDSAAPATATEDTLYTYNATRTDLDGPGQTWSLVGDTCGGAIVAGTGVYTFTPAGPTPPASCDVGIQICDGGAPDLCAQQTTTIAITAVNDAPIISTTPPPTAAEDVLYSYDADLTDPDGVGQTWSLDAANTCAGAAIVPATGVYTFTPVGPTPPADCVLAIQVCDGGVPDLCTVQTATVTINSSNTAPVIDSTAPTPATEDTLYTYNATRTDADGPGQTWSLLAGNTCTGASIVAGTGVYTFTPTGPTPPASCDVAIQVCDGGVPDLCAQQTTTIAITAVNDPPTISTLAPTTATEDVLYSYDADLTDPDGVGQTWSLAGTNTCAGAAIVPATGAYTFTPAGPNPPASCDVGIQVCDGGVPNECVTQTTTVTITAINSAPVIDSTAPATATEDTLYTYNATRTDPDGPGQTWSLLSDTCGGAIVAGTGVYTFTPTGPTPPASCDVGIQVCDGGAPDLCDTQTTTITITAVNDAPTISTTAPTTATEDTLLTYDADITDPDGLGQTWSLDGTNTCAGAAIVPATGVYTFTPAGPNPPANCVLAISVCDGGTPNQCTVQSSTVTITAVNDGPTNTVPGPQAVDEDTNLVFSVGNANLITVADGDATTMTVTLTATNGAITTNGTVGLSFSVGDGTADATMTFSGTLAAVNTALNGLIFAPAPNYFGPASVAIVSNDGGSTGTGGALMDSDSIAITVNPVNDAPTVTTPPSANVHTNIAIDQPDDATNDLLGSARGIADVDSTGPFVIAPANIGTFSTVLGGSITITADGHYHFNPQLHDTGADSFVYQICDNEGPPACTNVTLSLTIAGLDIVFVDDTFVGGDGTLERPLQTFAAGNGALAGSVNLFLFSGNYTGGVTLANNVRVFGQGSLAADFDTLYGITPPALSIARPALSQTRPLITSGGVGITLGQNNTLRGIELGANSTDALLGNGFGTLTVSDNVVINNTSDRALNLDTGTLAATFAGVTSNNSAAQGLFLDQVAGTLTLGGTTVSASATQGILVTASTATINFGNTSVTGGTDGISLGNNPTGTFNFGTITRTGGGSGLLHSGNGGDIAAGATTISGTSGLGIDIQGHLTPNTIAFGVTSVTKVAAGGAINLGGAAVGAANTGTVSFAELSGSTSNGAFLVSTANTGTLTVTTPSATAISATGGPALNIDAAPAAGSPVSLALGAVSSTNSATQGIVLNNITGTLTATGGSISGSTGVGFLGTGTLGTITYSGNISKTSDGNLVQISGAAAGTVTLSGNLTCNTSCDGIDVLNRTGGIITFSGASKVLDTTASASSPAVNLDNNDAAQIHFTGGGLDIDTTSGAGFNAINGATQVTVQGANNTIVSTTGIGLNVVGSTIGGPGLTFASVNVNGAPSGIVLDGTGSGGLTVVGAGGVCTVATPTCNGGTIQATTDDGVALTNANNVSLTHMRLLNAGNTTPPDLTTAQSVAGDHAVQISGGSNVILASVLIQTPGGGAVLARNLNGTNRINGGSEITGVGGIAHAIYALNIGVNNTLFEFDASRIFNCASASSTVVFFNEGTSNMTLSVTNSTFEGLSTQAFTVSGGGTGVATSGTLTSTFTGNTFQNATGTAENNIGLLANAGALHVATATNNIFDNVAEDGTIANTSVIRTQNSGGDIDALVQTNTIRNINYATGGRHLIGHVFEPVAFVEANDSDLTFDGNIGTLNIFYALSSREGIFVDHRGPASNSATRLLNNSFTIGSGAPSQQMIEFRARQVDPSDNHLSVTANTGNADVPVDYLDIDAEASATVNATVTNNVFNNSAAVPGDILSVNNEAATSVLCADLSTNTVDGGTGTIELTETAGALNVEHASAAAVAASNSVPGANVIVTGTPQFGAANCPTPP